MMTKSALLVAGTLATLLAGAALADDKSKRRDGDHNRGQAHSYRHDDRRYDHRRDDQRRYDQRRYDHWRDDRRWRHFPPAHYRSNSGYRAGYEFGWRDGSRYCGFDRYPGRWHRDRHDSYWYFGFGIDG